MMEWNHGKKTEMGLRLQMKNYLQNGSIALWFPDRNINGKQNRITFVIFLKATAFNLKLSRHKKLLLFSQLFLSPPSLTPPTHIQSPNPLTCITRCTTWAAVPYMQLSARCECLKLPEAQIISLTSLKTHETLHRQQALSSSLCSPQSLDTSHPSCTQMDSSYHISFIFAQSHSHV